MDVSSKFQAMLFYALPRIVRKLDSSLRADQVEELASRIMHKLLTGKQLRQYRGGGRFLGWLGRVAFNARADYFREQLRNSGQKLDEEQADEVEPVERNTPRHDLLRAELLGSIQACFRQLSAKDQDLLRRRLVEGDEYVDIAAALKITASQAHTNFCRARRKLVELLAKAGVRPDNRKKGTQDSGDKDVSS